MQQQCQVRIRHLSKSPCEAQTSDSDSHPCLVLTRTANFPTLASVLSVVVVVLVADLGALLVEGGLRRHAEVHPLNSVGLLVVPVGNKELENIESQILT